MVDLTNKLTGMGRRRFLETLAAMGISAEAVRHMTKDKLESLTGDPTDEVPRLGSLRRTDGEAFESPPYPDELAEREPEYYTIPRDEWVRVETAFDAARRLQRRIDRMDDTGLVSAGVTTMAKGHRGEYAVSVTRRTQVPRSAIEGDRTTVSPTAADSIPGARSPDVTLDELAGELPDTAYGTVGSETFGTAEMDGIPISFSESVEWPEAESCEVTDDPSNKRFYEETYRYFRFDDWYCGTGCRIDTDPNGYDGTLSLGPRVASTSGGAPMFITSAHGTFVTEGQAEDKEELDPEPPYAGLGSPVYQCDGTHITDLFKIGEVTELKHYDSYSVSDYMDVALIEMDNPEEEIHAGRRLASQAGANEFAGQLSWDRVGKDYLKDKKGSVHKQGMRTGRCQHEIIEYVEWNDRPDEIRLYRENDHGGGNSGGPYFVNRNGRFEVAGVHRAGSEKCITDRCDEKVNIAKGIWIGDIENAFEVEVV